MKVLDFRLVKPVASKIDEHSLATAAGLTPGTPAYMAPETAMAESVDGRADIYALGCVAYYLLTGKLVFEGDTSLPMIVKHLQSDPVPPSKRTSAEIPPALERIVLACLAKRPEGRPSSAGELGRALSAVAIDPWTQEDAKRWWDDKRSPAPRRVVDVTNNTLTKSALDESAAVRAL